MAAEPPPSYRATLQQLAALYRAGQPKQALEGCRRLLAEAGPQLEILAIAGKLALELGELEEAAALYAAAREARPDAAEFPYNLGVALMRLGRTGEAVDAYRRAAALRPDLVPVQNNLGIALQALGCWEEAIQAYRSALARAPDAAELHRNLGIALEAIGRRSEAIASYRRGLAIKPDWPALYRNLVPALLEEGDARAALSLCDAWLRLQPGQLEAIGLKAVALEEVGDRAGARHLVDLHRFLRVVPFDTPPPGFASMQAFNAALTADILAHPTLAAPATSDPHYNGPGFRTTEEMFGPKSGAWAAFETMVRREIDDYLSTQARPDPSHPYLAHPPKAWRPSAVGTVLERLAALAPHVHYDGYVSGVYYSQLPDVIAQSAEERLGWLEVGRLQQRFNRVGKPEIRAIQPREGLMILFPSYFFHNTRPFPEGQVRVSIALDAIPVSK